jgi:peroxiredoxin
MTVFVFLSETCPICQSYTLPLKSLYEKYHSQNVQFIGVFPNYYSTQKDVDEFKNKYHIPFLLVKDKEGILTNKLNATITPQVFIQTKSDSTIYSGRIDNSFYAIGKRRNIVTIMDLDDALSQYLAKKTIQNPKTQAVGCIITSTEN